MVQVSGLMSAQTIFAPRSPKGIAEAQKVIGGDDDLVARLDMQKIAAIFSALVQY